MRKHLLPKEGNFYKACLHVHSNLSDGKASPEELKRIYMEDGYSIVAFTDHEVIIPHNDLAEDNFLPITSYELAVNDSASPWIAVTTTHLNFYAKDKNNVIPPVFNEAKVWLEQTKPYITPEMRSRGGSYNYSAKSINEIVAGANEEGFLVSYNHPFWSNQNYEDYCDYKGLWAIEWYNHECSVSGYTDTTVPLDDLLKKGESILPIATDDAHDPRNCGGGFVMVKAEKLEYDTIMSALEAGDFYSSNGPAISELSIEGGKLRASSPDAEKILVTSPHRYAAAVKPCDGTAEFDLNYYFGEVKKMNDADKAMAYFRVTFIDREGKKALSRAFRVTDFID